MIDFTVLAATRLPLILAVSIGLQACAILPAPGVEDVFISEEEIATVRVGQTNKEDLQKMLGSPDWSFSDGSQWTYHTRKYRPAGIGVLSEAYAGSLMNWRSEFLYVTFNNSNVVDNVEISVVEPDPVDGWLKREITDMCLEAYGTPLLYGSAREDTESKQFLIEPDKCAVYLYTETTMLPFLIGINSAGYARCPANDGFVRIDLNSGIQKISVISDNMFARGKLSQSTIEEMSFSETIALDCSPGDVFFVRQHFNGTDDFSFQIVPEEEGRSSIAARRLVLLQRMRLWSSRNLLTP
jgi:outer membrane protein assembly factor BamE (lipoprotein component of BamABCDE complex)